MDCKAPSTLYEAPYFSHPCSEVKEDHARHIIVHQYVTCIKIAEEWAIPLDSTVRWLSVPALVDILVGSCLWNPDYGFFKVVAFDLQAQRIKIQRKDVEATKAPGTKVPVCTKFIVTPDI